MPFQEHHPKIMSDFALPLLMKIPATQRQSVMLEKWNQVVENEVSCVQAVAQKYWDQCMQLVEGSITDSGQLHIIACRWSRIVRTITKDLECEYSVMAMSLDNNDDSKLFTETLKRMHVICDKLTSADHDDAMIVRASRSLEQLLRLTFGLPQDKAYNKYCAILKRNIRDRMGI